MEKFKIEQISRKTEMSAKTGREYEKIGLKINGEWCNGFGRKGVSDTWDSGMEITGIRIIDKEYQGKLYKNWEFVSLDERIAKLEADVESLKRLAVNGDVTEKKEKTDPIEDLPF